MDQTTRKRQKIEELTEESSGRSEEDAIHEVAAQTLAQLSRDLHQEAIMEGSTLEEAQLLLAQLYQSHPEATMEEQNSEEDDSEEDENDLQKKEALKSRRLRNKQGNQTNERVGWLMPPSSEKHTRVGSAFQVTELPVFHPKEEEKEG